MNGRRHYRAHLTGNRSQINHWLWIARYQLRHKRNARGALEAMLTACWLMGVET